jgi:hypothetical protein
VVKNGEISNHSTAVVEEAWVDFEPEVEVEQDEKDKALNHFAEVLTL